VDLWTPVLFLGASLHQERGAQPSQLLELPPQNTMRQRWKKKHVDNLPSREVHCEPSGVLVGDSVDPVLDVDADIGFEDFCFKLCIVKASMPAGCKASPVMQS
jgi:hypothetical protein